MSDDFFFFNWQETLFVYYGLRWNWNSENEGGTEKFEFGDYIERTSRVLFRIRYISRLKHSLSRACPRDTINGFMLMDIYIKRTNSEYLQNFVRFMFRPDSLEYRARYIKEDLHSISMYSRFIRVVRSHIMYISESESDKSERCL